LAKQNGRRRAAGFDFVHAGNAVLRSVANLDPANLPAIAIPEALANQTAGRLLDIDRRRRVINRRRRRGPRRQSATEQRPTDKSTDHAGGDLTILRSCGYR